MNLSIRLTDDQVTRIFQGLQLMQFEKDGTQCIWRYPGGITVRFDAETCNWDLYVK